MSKSQRVHDLCLFKDCKLKKIKFMFKYSSDQPVIKDFIDYIYTQPNSITLLTQFSELYVLVADMEEEMYSRRKWRDFMNEEQHKILEANTQYVLGYMLVNDNHGKDEHHYIDFINTRLKGCNIADFMIRKYVDERMVNGGITANYLYPQEIIMSAAGYWKKQLEWVFCCENYSHDIIDKIKIQQNIKMELKWDELLELLCAEDTENYESSDSDSNINYDSDSNIDSDSNN